MSDSRKHRCSWLSALVRGGCLSMALLAAAQTGGCSKNVETRPDDLITPQEEAKIGAAAHPEIIAQFGGSYDDPKLVGPLRELVQKLSRGNGAKGEDYRLTVLDTPVVNAFASPGGYVYVTRGLLALANDEAELAGVLAHELGHLTSRHSAKRQIAAERVSVFGGVLRGLNDSAYLSDSLRLGAARSIAAYSRDQELDADKLGMVMAAKAQYDPNGAVSFLTNLERHFALEAKRSAVLDEANNPSIYSSHPGTPERIKQVRAYALSFGDETQGYVRHRDRYLDLIDQLPYGESPAHGVLRDGLFLHPVLRIQFALPQNFVVINHKAAVLGRGPDDAIFIFDGAEIPSDIPLKRHLVKNWGEGLNLQNVRSFKVNGMAAAAAETLHKGVGHELVVIRYSPKLVYRFLFITRPVVTARYEKQFRSMVNSFNRLTEQQVEALRPRRISVITVAKGQTVERLARLLAVSGDKVARFRILNGLGPDDAVTPGQRVKIIVQ